MKKSKKNITFAVSDLPPHILALNPSLKNCGGMAKTPTETPTGREKTPMGYAKYPKTPIKKSLIYFPGAEKTASPVIKQIIHNVAKSTVITPKVSFVKTAEAALFFLSLCR